MRYKESDKKKENKEEEKKETKKENIKKTNGAILIDKPKGISSHDVLKILKSKENNIINNEINSEDKEKIKNKKADKNKYGHTGTLDPIATGILCVLLGNCCKLSKYLIGDDKTYIADILIGTKTDTLDITGKVIKSDEELYNKEYIWEKEKLEKALLNFTGNIIQIPPIYSALKYKGKKLYEIARQDIDDKEKERIINIKKRNVNIYNIEILNINKEEKVIRLKIDCSSGTYIRTLAEDIFESLNTFACVKDLRRIKQGIFNIYEAYHLDDLDNIYNIEKLDKFISEEDILKRLFTKKAFLEENRIKHFLNGVKCSINLDDGIYLVCEKEEKIIGLGKVKNGLIKREYIIDGK